MPYPGQANNPSGVNGQEDAHQAKMLERAMPVVSPPQPRRAQRRTVGRQGRLSGSSSALPPTAAPQAQGEVQAEQFWQAVLADPQASPLAKEYAQQALG